MVKGGRRFSFAAMVVVGDGKGKVGWGYGKANEVPPSVEKARKEGMRSMVEVPLEGSTIPHKVEGYYGAAHVVLVPASPGTGVIAGAGRAGGLRSRPASTTSSPRASARTIRYRSSRPRSRRSRNCGRKQDVERLRGVTLS